MKIGEEVLMTELTSMKPRATFEIACRDEESAQVLIVVSTQGECQSHRLEIEEQDYPT